MIAATLALIRAQLTEIRRSKTALFWMTAFPIGFLMLFQPFALSLYTWSFVTMLAGTAMFIVVSKFPE